MDGVNEAIMKKCLIWLLTVLLLIGCGTSKTLNTSLPSETSESETAFSETKITVPEEETLVSTESVPSPPATLSLIMVGDILLHDPVEAAALQEDGSYNYEAIFAHMTEGIQADSR